jgi:hypothetical protein
MPRQISKEIILLILSFLLISFTISFALWNVGFNVIQPNPAGSVAETAAAIWDEHTISRRDFAKVQQDMIDQSKSHPDTLFWQDVFAIGIDGTLYPKHPLLASILAAPFYGLFGNLGFWIFNQVVLFLLFVGIFKLAKPITSDNNLPIFLVLISMGTSIFLGSYFFSYDIVGVLLVVWSFAVVGKKHFIAGLLLALSLYIRITHLVFLPFLLICFPVSKKNISLILSGFLLGLFPLLVFNFLLWGDALSGPYARTEHYFKGQVVFTPSYHSLNSFSLENFLTNIGTKLFSLNEGMISVNPLFAVALIGIFYCSKHPQRRFILSCFFAGLTYTLLMLSYSYWIGAGGRRFVLPAVFLISLAVIPLIEKFSAKLKRN